jgi:hypothetical protein
MTMNTNLSAADLRRWAAQCDARAKDPLASGHEHEHLVRMRDGLLEVAAQWDWLDGCQSDHGLHCAAQSTPL